MSILKDTYNITNYKVDTNSLASQISKYNDILEKQNTIENETKDRVDISLKEYESLKKKLNKIEDELNIYKYFVKTLADGLNLNPKVLLNCKLIDCRISKIPMINKTDIEILYQTSESDINKIYNIYNEYLS